MNDYTDPSVTEEDGPDAGQLVRRLTEAEQQREDLVEGLDQDGTTNSRAQLRAMTPPQYDTPEHGVEALRTEPTHRTTQEHRRR